MTIQCDITRHDAHDVTMRQNNTGHLGTGHCDRTRPDLTVRYTATERYGTELYFTIQCDKTLHCRALLDNATKHYGTELYSTGHHLTMRRNVTLHNETQQCDKSVHDDTMRRDGIKRYGSALCDYT
jgi:hypothetical protein